jgi:hypothetical protein
MTTNKKDLDVTGYRCTSCGRFAEAWEFAGKSDADGSVVRIYWKCKACRKIERKAHRKPKILIEEDYSI